MYPIYYPGNEDQPQTWPLIRKVQLHGPWSVLSTGACLVDLPGVRDVNVARANVAKRYLKNCNQLCIVAPIKRAVVDSIAHNLLLLGDQFKSRLRMDGKYGNIFFVCSQTDDIEATETMRDHLDVAKHVHGRWEKMTALATDIHLRENQKLDLELERKVLECSVEDVEALYKSSKSEYEDAIKMSEDFRDEGEIEKLRTNAEANNASLIKAERKLAEWNSKKSQTIVSYQEESNWKQKQLKAIWAAVRNEYSKTRLKNGFRSGFKALSRDDGDECCDTYVQEDYDLNVFCVSSNDYLKIMEIKPSKDGPSITFSEEGDTEIPRLKAYVHEITYRF